MKKHLIKKLSAVMLSALGLSTLSFGVAGCMPKSTVVEKPENIEITKLAPPDDGSLPTAHTCAENLAYINYVFDRQPQYHSYSYGVTSASIATQTTRTFRDFKDGVLLTTDLTYSSMVKSGTQTCTVVNSEGESEVYFRVCGAPEADTLPSQADWSEDAPVIFNENSYNYTYGLLPTELFNYIINESTVIDSEQVKANPDGTYTQSFTLDPVVSTYYYQFGMKTRGGLSGYPEFESITFSVTFDGDWRILSSDMHEVSKINKGIVINSISDFNTQFWYGEERFDGEHYSYYDSYYKQYIGDDSLEQGGSTDEKPVIDVPNVLSNGFSQIMNGGAQFEITAQLGENLYTGYVFVSLDLADPLGTLALKLSLGKSLKEQCLFLEYAEGDMKAYYGKDFAVSANMAEVKLAVGQFEEIINKIAAVFSQPEQPAPDQSAPAVQEESDPLSDLMNQMVLTAGEKQAVLTLDTNDLLGLGIGVNLRLVFGINNNEITFRGGTVGGLSLGGEALDLGLTIRTTTAPEITMPSGGDCADLADYVADIRSLLGSDLLKIQASVHGSDDTVKITALKGLDLNLTAYADIYGLTVGADASVAYTYNGRRVSAAVSVIYLYNAANGDWGEAVLRLTELNGSPREINLKCNVKELADALSTLLTFGGADAGASTDGLVKTLNGVLSADLYNLLTEMYADKAQIKVGVNVDTLFEMFGIDAGVKFGSCALKYVKGDGVYGGVLSAELPALGFDMSVSGAEGEIEIPDTDDYLDLTYVAEDIISLVNAELYRAQISFDGSADGVSIAQLGGIKADLTAYFDPDGIAVAAEADISYTYNGQTVSAKLAAFYEKGESKYGDLILSLTHINGKQVNANVYCNIDELAEAVTALLGYAGVQIQPFETGVSANLQDILLNVLEADFNKLLPVIETGADGLRAQINADEALALFGLHTGVSFGNINLAYNRGAENMLVAEAPAFGLSVAVGGASGKLDKPSSSNCLNLTKLVNTVNAVWEQVDGIIESQSIAFEIVKGETFLSLDGIVVDLWGEGEICWKAGSEYVALDLSASITERASDVVAIKLIYNKNATDTPLIRLALNGVGIDIYRDDIQTVSAGIKDIYNKIAPLLGISEEEGGEEIPAVPQSPAFDGDKLMGLVFKVLSADGWVDELNRITLSTDGKSFALEYLSENAASVEIRADGALELYYGGAFGSGFTLGGGLVATAVKGGLVSAIEAQLENCKMSSSKTEGSAAFVRLAYDYLFEAIDAIGVENILGSGTYTVTFALIGDNCNIPELKGVNVDVQIYVTGEKGEQGKLAEADLNIDVSGVAVKLNVITERRGNTTYFYMNLSQVADKKLPDLKFMATQDSLYETFAVLLNTLNNTNVLEVIGGFISGNQGSADTVDKAPANGAPVLEESTIDKVCGILTKLLDFNFSSAVVATETDGVLTATIDLDNIVKQLGYQTGTLGTVEAVINRNSHAMKTSGKTLVTDADGVTQLKEWISLSSEMAPRRDYSSFVRADYISIEFLPSLIDDIVKFATDGNGNIHNQFTLSGSVDIDLVSIITVKIENATLTVNLGKDGFYFSFVGYLTGSSLITKGVIGVSYQDGYLTLGRYLGSANPEYRVMTFDYFIDNMFAKGDASTVNWLIGANNTIWNMVVSGMGDLAKNMNSGLTTPQDVYLYKAQSNSEETEISMYDYINALRIIINGNQTALIGDYSAMENKFGVYDNYYGADLNAKLLTGDVLTALYAVITRDDLTGINGVNAYGEISSYVKFKASLGYNEGLTSDNEYKTGTELTAGVTAPCLNALALARAAEANVTVDFNHYVKNPEGGYDEIFGCFNTADMSHSYSRVLYSHMLTVIGLDGSEQTREVRHGSTVYLYDNYSPVYTDGGKSMRLLYSLSDSEVGAASVVMNGDLTVYALQRKAVTVIVHNGDETVEISSFAGDKVPVTVNGLETLTAPEYADGTPVGENDVLSGEQSAVHIYGTFVKTEVVVNYVKYVFDAQSRSYTAAGKAAGFNDYYSVKGNNLSLENQIGGYPVTAIAAGAFANTEDKPIVSVTVPANITTVGQEAFRDNYGMKRAVFLAGTVKFEGSDGSAQSMPFAGCSRSSSDEKVGGVKQNEVTDLVVYYNNITADGGNWRHFRYVRVIAAYNFYIGKNGGAIYAAGEWQYVDYDVTVDLGGVVGSALSEQAVRDVLAPYFPAFRTDEFVGSADEAEIERKLEAALTQFDILRGGIVYTCAVTTAHEKNGCYEKITYNVSYKATATVNVFSACAFTYNGTAVGANAVTQINATVSDGKIELAAPKAEGYVFLGWAAETDGKLQFVGSTVENSAVTYYAIWGTSKVGATVTASVHYSGATLSAPASGNGRWYDGNWNEVTEISKETTVVYTRETYTVSYKISGNMTMNISDTLSGTSKSGTSFSNSFSVLEGQRVTAVRVEGKKVEIRVDGELVTTLTLAKWGLFNYDIKDNAYDQTIAGDLFIEYKW